MTLSWGQRRVSFVVTYSPYFGYMFYGCCIGVVASCGIYPIITVPVHLGIWCPGHGTDISDMNMRLSYTCKYI